VHVVDVDAGAPGRGVPVRLLRADDGDRIEVDAARTGHDGRGALGPADRAPGTYTLVVELEQYFVDRNPFVHRVALDVVLVDGDDVHIPVLVSPRFCSFYRGVG
jgi:5-hydroxyisourate hydrolase-like protein (transthyretin family)